MTLMLFSMKMARRKNNGQKKTRSRKEEVAEKINIDTKKE